MDPAERRALYTDLLVGAYRDFTKSDARTEKVFRVFRLQGPRTATVDLSASFGNARMRPELEYGKEARALRNDGTYPGLPVGRLLIRRGSVGYVRDVGTFLQDQIIFVCRGSAIAAFVAPGLERGVC